MKKFAFLVHLRSNYNKDLKHMAAPLGWIPDSVYRYALRNRPLPPFIWSDVTLTPGATEPEGYIIMLPYSGRQLLEQQKLMVPLVEQAAKLAASKGAEIMGLGALSSPITMGGKLVENNPHLSVTNGNAYTAVITHERIAQLIDESPAYRPVVALVGATGSVGSLVCKLLAKHNPEAEYLLVARNERRLVDLASEMTETNFEVKPTTSQHIDDVKRADIVVLLTSASDCLLQSSHLKPNAVVLDDTQPRNTHPRLLTERPDVTIIDGGLVSVPHLKTNNRGIGLPRGLSYACLAETMLLAKAGYEGNFSIGNPTLEQAEYIRTVSQQFSHLGFDVAPDHSFGRRIAQPTYTHNSRESLAEL
ncbi:shikimate dehydrogenase [Spirosoma sp. BT702]|uniref:Shikimate dehydrogenase n=1 Tax=Spirosoma profusum TaxID=2771354 RepID=A0A926XT93_9BACT|nr:shikimate dehydrogenase [Spirosoma profusum]MBD2699592.1 shikimate dehydrogenase [Spirosoma profusum]